MRRGVPDAYAKVGRGPNLTPRSGSRKRVQIRDSSSFVEATRLAAFRPRPLKRADLAAVSDIFGGNEFLPARW